MRHINIQRTRIFRIFVGIILLLAGCAAVQEQPAVLQPGKHKIVMTADNFSFEPNSIKVTPGALEIMLQNVSDTEHNITIIDPQGGKDTLISRDIDAGATELIAVALYRAGTYSFHCDKRFHTTLGMKGEIEVTDP